MISGTTFDAFLVQPAGGLDDRARLHLGDLGIGDAEADAAMAEHRVELVELLDARQQRASSRRAPCPSCPVASSRAISTISSSRFGRNSCSGGSMVRIVTGVAVHRLEDAVEVVALQRQQLVRAPCGDRLRCRRGSSAARSGCGPRRRTCARCGTGRCRGRRTRRRARPDPAGRRWRGRRGGGTCRPTTAACRSADRCRDFVASSVPLTTCRISLGFDATLRELHFAGQAVERDEVAFLDRLAVDA